jgi:uncharacterized membrane protein
VRLHFQEKPWDLYAAVGYTVVTTIVLLALNVGNALSIFLVLFVPGYVLVAALFPRNTEIDWIERIALSFGMSVAVVPLLGLLLNFTPFGIRFAPILSTIALYTASVGYAAYLRRMKLPTDRRLSLTVALEAPKWKEYSALDKGLTIVLIGSIVAGVSAIAYVLTTPGPGERFTEFYLLGPGGNASAYPTRLNVSEPGTLILSVVNHEFARVTYMVRVDLLGVNAVFNTTCNCSQTQDVNRTSLTWLNQTLGDKETWSQQFTFRINATGLWKLEFLLFKDSSLTSQTLRLFIQVL